jgi:hypothetical protein
MNRESFLEAVKEQYADEIHEAYLECEHGEKLDLPKLESMLARLMAAASHEGISASDFKELVRTTLPDHADELELLAEPKAA